MGALPSPALLPRLRAAASAGFSAVELDVWSVEKHLAEEGGSVAALRDALAALGLRCAAVVGLDLAAAVSERKAVERLADGLRPEWLLCYAGSGEDEVAVERALAAAAQRHRLDPAPAWRPCLEFRALPICLFGTAERALAVAKPLGVPIVVDSWHVLAPAGGSLESLCCLSPRDIAYVQLADGRSLRAGAGLTEVGDETRRHRALPGQGLLDVGSFCRWLQNLEFAGTVSAEVLSNDLWALDAEDEARRTFASVRSLFLK